MLLDAARPRSSAPRTPSRSARSPSSGASARTAGCPLVGFDDTPVARALGLSSVHQPVELAAERLIAMVADLLDGRTPQEPQQLLTPELVLRELAPFAQ